MAIVHSRQYLFAFSMNKQSAIGTAITNAQINKLRPSRNFAPITYEPVRISDRQWYGKGHGWPTFSDVVTKGYVINGQERSATSLETLYAAAMVMGNVVSTQPDSAAYPETYQHVVTFQDTAVNREVIYTTVGEMMGNEYKKSLSGAWINSFTLTGNRADHVTLGFEGAGRKYATGTWDEPTLNAASFYKTLFGTVSFGNDGAPGDISAEVLSWNLTISQNATPYYLMGNATDEENLVTKVLVGDQIASGQFVVFVNSAHRDRFLNATDCELTLVLGSPDYIVGVAGYKHQCTITIPKLRIASESFGEEGQTVAYTMTLIEESILKATGEAYLTLTFISDIGTTELLVAA